MTTATENNTALVQRDDTSPTVYGDVLSIRQITQNVVRVQSAMESVMKENVHYGTIPGTPKPSLWKPGAEILNMMFRIAVDPDRVEDLSGVDHTGYPFIRYRVRLRFVSQATDAFLGSAWGECSTLEEKYKWRRATGPKEFAAAPADRKREKFRRGRNNTEYSEQQVRTEPDDLANTILQMAIKRAEVSGTKRVTACSDIFAQDLEDLPAEIVASVAHEDADKPAPPQPAQRKSEQAAAAPTPPPNGTAAPAAKAEPAAESRPNNVGKIVAVGEKQASNGNIAYSVKLNTGYSCGTFSKSLADAAKQHKEQGAVVELTAEPPKKEGFAPKLIEISPAGEPS